MRVTAEVKAQTERGILEAGRQLFCRDGFEETSTREIARCAGVASGTVFNYFASKESLASAIVGEALEAGVADFQGRLRGDESAAEGLFLLIASQLRRLEGLEGVVEGALALLVASGESDPASHVDAAASILAEDGSGEMALRLYQVMHGSVIALWLRDESPGREDTLAVVDRVTRMIGEGGFGGGKENGDGC